MLRSTFDLEPGLTDVPHAIQIVDFFHVAEKLGEVAAALHDDDPVWVEAWAEARCAASIDTNRARIRYPESRAAGPQSGFLEAA